MTATCPKFAAVWAPESVIHNMVSAKGIMSSVVSQTQKDSHCNFIGQRTVLNSEVVVVITRVWGRKMVLIKGYALAAVPCISSVDLLDSIDHTYCNNKLHT